MNTHSPTGFQLQHHRVDNGASVISQCQSFIFRCCQVDIKNTEDFLLRLQYHLPLPNHISRCCQVVMHDTAVLLLRMQCNFPHPYFSFCQSLLPAVVHNTKVSLPRPESPTAANKFPTAKTSLPAVRLSFTTPHCLFQG
jgi:hypothetical protein